jgi:hypothetical protein
VTFLEPHYVPVVAWLECDCAVGRRRACAKLARLADSAVRELGAGDAGRKAKVVLDASRRSSLPAECSALDQEGVKSFGAAIDGRTEAGGAAADDQQISVLAGCELAPNPEGTEDVTSRGLL